MIKTKAITQIQIIGSIANVLEKYYNNRIKLKNKVVDNMTTAKIFIRLMIEKARKYEKDK